MSTDEARQQALYEMFSTNIGFKYLIEQFFGEISDANGKWIDIHDKRVMKILSLPRNGIIIYNNSIPVTTHSSKAYGTTSLWWLIVACSDYTHGHEIPTNTEIRIPTY